MEAAIAHSVNCAVKTFSSDVQQEILDNIFWNVMLKPSMHFEGVVGTSIGDLLTDGLMDRK